MKHNFTKYCADFFNIFDLFGHILIIIYCSAFLEMDNEDLKGHTSPFKFSPFINSIHLIANFCIILRGFLSTFRLHDSTRYLVGMILAVFNDIKGFTCVLFSAVILFSVSFMQLARTFDEKALSIGGDKPSIIESLHLTYNMIFAIFDYKFETNTIIGWIFYLMATQFMIVIMLNLLISIVSDTYDRI